MQTEFNVAPLVARVSDAVAARLEEVAAEAGVSYHTLYAWGRGRRNARAEHLLRLADVVRRRAQLLEELASELEEQARPAAREENGRHASAELSRNPIERHARAAQARAGRNGARHTA